MNNKRKKRYKSIKIVGSYNSYIDYTKVRTFPAKIVMSEALIKKTWELNDTYVKQVLNLNEYFKVQNREEDHITMKFYSGISDFYETYFGSIIYSAPMSNLTIELPYQVPIVIPNLGSFQLPIDLYPTREILDTVFFAVEIKIRKYRESKLFNYIYSEIKKMMSNSHSSLDEKFLLKAIVNWPILRFSINPREEFLEYYARYRQSSSDSMPSERWGLFYIRRFMFPLDFFKVVTFNKKDFATLKYRTLLINRIEEFLNVYYRLKRSGNERITFVDALLKFAEKKIIDRFDIRRKRQSIENIIDIDIEKLSYLVFIAFIEMSLHGISHLIAKSIPSIYPSLSRYRFGELISIKIPAFNEILSPHNRIFKNSALGIFDGFLYRSTAGPGEPNSLYGLAIVYSRESNTGLSVKGDLTENKNKKFVPTITRFLVRQLHNRNSDVCYSKHINTHYPIKLNAFETILSNLRIINEYLKECNIKKSDALKDFKELLDDFLAMKKQKDRVGDMITYLEHKLFVPLIYLRKVIFSGITHSLVNKYIERSNAANKEKLISNCSGELRKEIIKLYSQLIYEIYVPTCFDSCHNCVLWEDCGYPSPLAREFLVSKFALKKILNLI